MLGAARRVHLGPVPPEAGRAALSGSRIKMRKGDSRQVGGGRNANAIAIACFLTGHPDHLRGGEQVRAKTSGSACVRLRPRSTSRIMASEHLQYMALVRKRRDHRYITPGQCLQRFDDH